MNSRDEEKASRRVLVVSPHPDDESLGCGGTLRGHVVAGDTVRVLFLTSGENGGHGVPPELVADVREKEAQEAASILGIADITFCREKDGALTTTPSLLEHVRRAIEDFQPDVIYLPHDHEMHPDHRAAVDIVRHVLERSARDPDVWMFEVWTPTQRIDQVVDISAFAEVKRQAIRAYRSQCAVIDFEQAVMGLNRYRGEMHSWPEGEFAEVFTRLELKPCPPEKCL
ncbi:MAG TPA: PIG-L deacetylase family protein [Pirellulales bacterium]|jgi:LmbE family N-acetylglucosaminyl deacetylase|nr:PIG-L deacetylase family protein [Pirellulales bacterium]